MKFTISRDVLMTSVQNVMKAISSRTAVPILTGMKIEAQTDGITLTGSDSDISIESFIPTEEDGTVHVEHIEPGDIIIQARFFPDIIRKLPDQTVEIATDENMQVKIRSGEAEFQLNGQDASEYPQFPALIADQSFKIPADMLKNLIKQTAFAISTMETRPILTGINVKLEDNTLTFTATDSHRLASKQIPVEETDVEFPSIVIPGKSLNELNKILTDKNDAVEISITKNQILFRTEHLSFMSRLLNGNYPETSRLIPDQSKTVVHVQTKSLLHMIERASLLAKEDSNNVVKLNTIGNEQIEITSHSPEIGHVEEKMQIDSMEGEDVKISFSSKYMIDALKAIEYESVKIDFTGGMRPFVLRPANDDPILQLILPVRTF